MPDLPDDICPRPDELPPQATRPLALPIYPTSVWCCDDTEQAWELLEGKRPGYVYQRDGHPNADLLADKCRLLHGAEEVAVTASGMSALAAALLSQLECGQHMIVSSHLYGRSLQLLTQESARVGITSSVVDTCDLQATKAAIKADSRMMVVETIANPRLHVADIQALADLARPRGIRLLVDNTFATPVLCRPLALGADLVMESVSKMMNGHSDVMLGVLCGGRRDWQRVPQAVAAWGLTSSPFDCYLASRGMATMHLRVRQASHNALEAAHFLESHPVVEGTDYPGLPSHPQHELAGRQLAGGYGSVVTFQLQGGLAAAESFISAARRIPFCPSLGEVSTTLSHPVSTSHRGLTEAERAALGITPGTIRLSVGCESTQFVLDALAEALSAVP